MALDPQLLEILACPEDKGPLLYFEDEDILYNPRLKRRYRIDDDIPIMLIDEAETVDDAEHERLLAKAEAEGIEPRSATSERDDRRRLPRDVRRGRGPARAGRGRRRAGHGRSTACPTRDQIENVVVLGMGGSGVAGDLLAAIAGPFMPVPVVVVEGLRAAVLRQRRHAGVRHVVLGQHRGDRRRGDDGGQRRRPHRGRHPGRASWPSAAARWGAPVVPIADDIPQPRAGLGRAGHAADRRARAHRPVPRAPRSGSRFAVDQLKAPPGRARRRRQPGRAAWPTTSARPVPIIYGGGGLGGLAATRWKTQFNENAGRRRSANTNPELCHNEIAGWGQHGDLTRQVFTLVNLRHDFEHPQVMRRFDLMEPWLDEVVGDIYEVRAEGEGAAGPAPRPVPVRHFTCLHLAAQEGIDPGPVPVLDELKAALAT